MKKNLLITLLFVIIIHAPVHAIRKDTKLILEKLAKLEALITNLEQKVTIISTEFSSMFSKVKIIETKVAAMTRNQADTNEGKENLLLSLQFIKEEINSFPCHLQLARSMRQTPPLIIAKRTMLFSHLIVSTTLHTQIFWPKTTNWLLMVLNNSLNCIPHIPELTTPCIGLVNVTTRKGYFRTPSLPLMN